MKYKFIIIAISLLVISFLFYLFLIKCYRKLPEVSSYSIVSDIGMPIPAKLYSRTVMSTMNGKEEEIDQLILCFNDTLVTSQSNTSGDEKLYKFLVIIPNLKVIGLIDHINSLKEKEKYICQKNDDADNFTSIINNYTFFSNPPISDVIFADKKITFNTYGILRRFGKNIVISY